MLAKVLQLVANNVPPMENRLIYLQQWIGTRLPLMNAFIDSFLVCWFVKFTSNKLGRRRKFCYSCVGSGFHRRLATTTKKAEWE